MFFKISGSFIEQKRLRFNQEEINQMLAAFDALKLAEQKAQTYLVENAAESVSIEFQNAIGMNFCDSWFVCGDDSPEQNGYALSNSISDLINNFVVGHFFAFEYGDGFVVYNAETVPQLLYRLDKERTNLMACFASELLGIDNLKKL